MKAIPIKEYIAGLATLAFVHWVWCKVSYYLMLMPDKKKSQLPTT